ncbi:hypothetical protein G6M50_31245 [Agrobacterium rhizogenes]|jgi:hypothetical protein|uniref:Uncharacterized protein n=3 Tax=Rhizobium TaxID=379 RepID=A0A1C3TVW4_9HYPH|nr:hypothetical protein [Rhizobium multihospitium]NTJ62592.1 hypothetical protein [Rhizobium rhizogenes]NTJ82265.1 hypothetical protein [Rhizobium rhizogenes]SCB07275.1 hypothetical protein GA0061103_1059 [Rhizobium multihospitium]
MNMKIVTAQSEVETDDTGTYPDGMMERILVEFSASSERQHRKSHERDYGAHKALRPIPAGLA